MHSPCCVFAIVRRDTRLPADGAERGTARLTMVPWRDLAAVTERMTDDGAPLTTEALVHHAAVVEAVRRQGPALPVRFGTVFRDATSVASALAERYEPLAADLDRLGDKVELSLTALWAVPPSDAGLAKSPSDAKVRAARSAGARYLLTRAAASRRDDALKDQARGVAERLNQALAERALECRVSLLPTPRIAVRVAYLLDPAAVDDFRGAVDAMCEGGRDIRLLLTGPWPPYTFVRRNETDGGTAPGGRLAQLAQILTDAMRGHHRSDRTPHVDN